MENKSCKWIITIHNENYSNLINVLSCIEKDFQKIAIVEVKEDIRISLKLKNSISFEELSKLFNCSTHKEPIKFEFEKTIYFDK